jgi:tetratricopeptide (TPR) repeat protein
VKSLVTLVAALALIFVVRAPAHALTSSEIDAWWNFDDPAASEARFRAERTRWPDRSPEALEIDTQIARTLGLQRRFDAAHALLDAVSSSLWVAPPRLDVRFRLERGRVANSSGAPDQAMEWFLHALDRTADDRAPEAEYYRIDALHMLGIAAPPGERMGWNAKALAAADTATEPRARRWRASLLNNLGWSLLDQGNAPAALFTWQQALVAREASGDVARTREARWTVARGLRATGKLDEAERVQRALADETERAGAPDPYVYDELAEIARARNDASGVDAWTAKAKAVRSK